MRTETKNRKNMRYELSERFLQLSRQRKNNNEQYKMWGDLSYLEKAKMIDAAMQKICDEFAHYDDIQYRERLNYAKFYREQNKKIKLTNGYVDVYVPVKDVNDYISYYPEFYRIES